MKYIQTLMLFFAFISNSYALSLVGTNGVEILAVDGKAVKSSFFSKENNEFSSGKHQVVVRYANQFNNDELLESRPAIFTIDLQQDTEISVQNMNNQRQAEKLIKAGLTWKIISEKQQYEIKDSDILQGQGFMPYSDIESLITTYNKENNIVTPVVEATAVTAAATQVAVQNTEEKNIQVNNDVDAQLISLYQAASQEQKKAFRLWLIEQDMQ